MHDEIRQLAQTMVQEMIAAGRARATREELAADAAVVARAKTLAEKLGAIDWRKVLEFFLAVWEVIAPFLLDEDEETDEED